MVTKDLLDFVRSQRDEGDTREAIEQMLVTEGGWDAGDVSEAFDALLEEERSAAPHEEERAVVTPMAESHGEILAESMAQPVVAPVVQEVRSEPASYEPAPPAPAPTPALAPATAPVAQEVKPEPFPAPVMRSPEPASVIKAPESEHVQKSAPPRLVAISRPAPVEAQPAPSGIKREAQTLMPTYSYRDEPEQAPALAPAPVVVPPPEPVAPPVSVSEPVVAPLHVEEPEQPPKEQSEVRAAPINVAPQPVVETPEEPVVETQKTPVDPFAEKAVESHSIAEMWTAQSSPFQNTIASDASTARASVEAARVAAQGDGSFPADPAASVIAASGALSRASATTASKRTAPLNEIFPRPGASGGGHGAGASMKSIFGILLVIAMLAGIGFGAWYFLRGEGPSAPPVPVDAAVTSLFTAQSLTYGMTLSGDVTMQKEIDRSGPASMSIKTGSAMNGNVAIASDGFGNGTHMLRFSGAYSREGTALFGADAEAEFRIVGDNIYIRFVNPPRSDIVDPEVFTSYWIRVSMTELAKQFSLEGLSVTDDGLGRFGGSEATSFSGALKSSMPFELGESLSDEPVDGVPSYHFRLTFKEEETIVFLQSLYRQYLNADLVFSDEDRVRFGGLLKKLRAEVWMSRSDGKVKKFTLAGELDDVLFGYRTRGDIAFAVTLTPGEAESAVEIPSPALSVEEFKTRIDDYVIKRQVEERDMIRLDLLDDIERALAQYRTDKGRYPPVLADLVLGEYLDSTIPDDVLEQYYYHPYASFDVLDKAHRCANRAKLCPFYHLGVNLEDASNLRLKSDADIRAELRGLDREGCGGETGLYCLDLVPSAAANGATPAP